MAGVNDGKGGCVVVAAGPGEFAGKVIGKQDLAALLAPFGMIVTVDPDQDMAMQTAQMANALVGAVEAHASRAEDAYRRQGADPADLVQVGLMAFAGVPCQGPADDLALIQWRGPAPGGRPNSLDFPGPVKRQGDIGSGDALTRTMRLTAAALAAMAKAAHTSIDPARGPGAARDPLRTRAGPSGMPGMSSVQTTSAIRAGGFGDRQLLCGSP